MVKKIAKKNGSSQNTETGSSKTFELVKTMLSDMANNELLDLVDWIQCRLVRPVGVKVVRSATKRLHTTCYYDVVLMMSDGTEKIVDFLGCIAQVVYVYLLMHPEGVMRYSLVENDFSELRHLYSMMYYRPAEDMTDCTEEGSGHYISQAITNSRSAISKAIGDDVVCKDFRIDKDLSRQSKLVIPFARYGGEIVIDSSLTNI